MNRNRKRRKDILEPVLSSGKATEPESEYGNENGFNPVYPKGGIQWMSEYSHR